MTEGKSVEVAKRPERLGRLVEVQISMAAGMVAWSGEAWAVAGPTAGVLDRLMGLVQGKGSNVHAERLGIQRLFSLCLAKEKQGGSDGGMDWHSDSSFFFRSEMLDLRFYLLNLDLKTPSLWLHLPSLDLGFCSAFTSVASSPFARSGFLLGLHLRGFVSLQ